MGRLVLGGALVLGLVATAAAAPKRKVQIETEPPGASVYLGEVESGALCETPCTIDAPLGSSILVLRLDKHEAEIVEIDVPKGKGKFKPPSFKLKGAMATVVVEGPKGAKVRINQEDQGTAPVRVPVPSGEGIYISVTHNGKNLFDEFVDLKTNEDYVVKTKGASSVSTATISDDDDDDDGGGGGGGGSGGNSGGDITDSTDTSPRRAYVSAAVVADLGFRSYSYSGKVPMSGLRDLENEDGEFIMGPAIEAWPGRMLGIKPLKGLSAFVRLQFPVAGPTVIDEQGQLDGTVKTKWSSYEVSLRQRWTFGADDAIGVEVSPGYVQDTFTYGVTVGADLMKMPAARYQALRIGGKLVYSTGMIEPYISAENRIVVSSSHIDPRLSSSEVSGLRATLGLAIKLGSITGRVEGTAQSYSWTFSTQSSGMDPPATAATDSIKLVSFLVGYSY